MTSRFTRVCNADDIDEGAAKVIDLNGVSVLLARLGGEFFAIDNICSHDGGDLGEGALVDGQVECPRHGAMFDIRTGEATRMPAAVGVDRYDVKVENGSVYIAGLEEQNR
ncbi:MAG: non-heme iron oxygenase ferredoxin subunit [Candidatus Zixiibacteriota bacterium]